MLYKCEMIELQVKQFYDDKVNVYYVTAQDLPLKSKGIISQ